MPAIDGPLDFKKSQHVFGTDRMFLLPAFFVCFHSAQLGSHSIGLTRSYQPNVMVDELDAANGHLSIGTNKCNISRLPGSLGPVPPANQKRTEPHTDAAQMAPLRPLPYSWPVFVNGILMLVYRRHRGLIREKTTKYLIRRTLFVRLF